MAFKKQNTPTKLHIKTGDTVLVLSGDDKGKKGVVKQVFPSEYRAIVEGINKVKRHVKPTAERTGGIEEREAPLHISKLMLVDAEGIASRIKREVRNGQKVRVSKKTSAVIADPHQSQKQS